LEGDLRLSPGQAYAALFSEQFLKGLSRHRHLQARVEELCRRICEDPYSPQSHLLTKGKKADLRGKRARHLDPNFVVVYGVCEECVLNDWIKFNRCPSDVCTAKPEKRVIFFAFGKHRVVYGRDWTFRRQAEP
jgi:mRNA-degrading endonuclease YafQ of YafQ-DinJ toxin-antitoxin module